MTLVHASNTITEGVNISPSSDQFDFLMLDSGGVNGSTRYSWLTTGTDDVQAFGVNIQPAAPFGLINLIQINLSNDSSPHDVVFTGITGATGNDNVTPARLSIITDGPSAFFAEVMSFADGITGSGFHDTLYGGAGNDGIRGRGGNDLLRGGSGHDILSGGNGADNLGGGSGRDRFDYDNTWESEGQLTDTIIDFVGAGIAPGDRIDISDIDANQQIVDHQAFTFLGVVPSGVLTPAGSVYVRASGNDTLFLANTNDTASADWGVRVRDGSIPPSDYSAQDLILL